MPTAGQLGIWGECMSKTILVLADGLNFDAAAENLGYAEHLIESGKGAKYKVRGELPSLSRPMYETLLTGRTVSEHGIANNLTVRVSSEKSVFDLCSDEGRSTGAAAYHWISELYRSAPFAYETDRMIFDRDGAISHGIFYFEDSYPDSHVFADAEYIRSSRNPDFLMIHSMNIDDAGHRFGSESDEYHMAAAKLNVMLSAVMPIWLEQGYSVLVTADHGMNNHRLHGGNTSGQRDVVLYLFAQGIHRGDFSEGKEISQLCVAPLLCRLLEMAPAPGMRKFDALGVNFFE